MLGPGDPQELQEVGFPISDTVWLLCDPVSPLRDAAPSFQALWPESSYGFPSDSPCLLSRLPIRNLQGQPRG